MAQSGAMLEKWERVEACIQKLRLKYGRSCLVMGYAESDELGISQFGRDETLPPGFSRDG